MSVLRFDNVSKQYPGGHVALADVSFAVAPGEMLFVTGHSGAGKSTLLKLIQLAERPSRGTVLFDEKNLAKVRGGKVALHRRSVGVVYQNHQLLTDRSVGENVALPLILRGMKRGEIGKRVRSMLERLGLGPRERALPTQLSAGEQQRVGIARAASVPSFRYIEICREVCTSLANRCTLPSTTHSPSGSASATAITPMVSRVAHGLRNTRPRLATKL